MRITDSLIFQRASSGIARAREASAQAQALVSDGRRVVHPGDDPAVAGAIAAFQLSSARNAALSQAADSASSELGAADGSFEQVANAVTRAQELAVRFSNDVYKSADRAAGAAEMKGLLQTAIVALNARFGNRYIFGGNKDDAPPFDPAGAYTGDTGVRQVEIAPGVTQDASVRADVAVKGASGGVDVLQTLQQLQTALASNDVTGIRAALDPLGKGIDQVATARAEAGVAMDVFASASEAGKMASLDQQAQISRIADVDLPTASVQLAQAQRALEASMTAAAQGFKLSLVDFLR